MGTKSLNQRVQLFDEFSTHLNLLRKDPLFNLKIFGPDKKEVKEDAFICPFCYHVFFLKDLHEEHKLSIEHILPGSVGGTSLTMTCKKCNNQHGHLLDVHIKKAANLRDFQIGDSFHPAKIKVNSHNFFNGQIKFIPDKGFEFRMPDNHPYANLQLADLQKQWEGAKINFKIDGPNMQRYQRAIARVGYLLMFKKFGYPYILSPGGKIIREYILGTNTISVIFTDQQDVPHGPGIYLVKQPEEARSFLLLFTIQREKTRDHVALLLPGPTADAVDNYKNINPLSLQSFSTSNPITEVLLHEPRSIYLIWNANRS